MDCWNTWMLLIHLQNPWESFVFIKRYDRIVLYSWAIKHAENLCAWVATGNFAVS